jgi:hypothetical protein
MDQEAALQIIALVAEGRTVTGVCEEMCLSRASFYACLHKDGSLSDAYARACDVRDEGMEDEILAIADGEYQDAQSQRNRLDARYRLLAARKPQRWGNKLDLTVQTKGDPRDAQRKADARLARLAPQRVPQLIDSTALLLGTLADKQSADQVSNPGEGEAGAALVTQAGAIFD